MPCSVCWFGEWCQEQEPEDQGPCAYAHQSAAHHHPQVSLWGGDQHLWPLGAASAQACYWPPQPLWSGEANYLHWNRSGGGGGSDCQHWQGVVWVPLSSFTDPDGGVHTGIMVCWKLGSRGKGHVYISHSGIVRGGNLSDFYVCGIFSHVDMTRHGPVDSHIFRCCGKGHHFFVVGHCICFAIVVIVIQQPMPTNAQIEVPSINNQRHDLDIYHVATHHTPTSHWLVSKVSQNTLSLSAHICACMESTP